VNTYITNPGQGRPRRTLEESEVSLVCQGYANGLSMATVGRMVGISHGLVSKILKEENVDIRTKRGQQQDIDEAWIDRQLEMDGPSILERRRRGDTFLVIAQAYGLSMAYMRKHVVKLGQRRQRLMNEMEENVYAERHVALGNAEAA